MMELIITSELKLIMDMFHETGNDDYIGELIYALSKEIDGDKQDPEDMPSLVRMAFKFFRDDHRQWARIQQCREL
jgi:hypothetical protein